MNTESHLGQEHGHQEWSDGNQEGVQEAVEHAPIEETTGQEEPTDEEVAGDESEPESDEYAEGTDEEINQNVRGGEFTWADVASVAQFAVSLNAQSPRFQAFFRELIQNWSDSVGIARHLNVPGYTLSSLDFVISFTENIGGGQVTDFKKLLAIGSQIGDMDTNELRLISKMFSTVCSEYPKDPDEVFTFRYRANMDGSQVVNLFVDAANNVSEDGINALGVAQMLLGYWPGH